MSPGKSTISANWRYPSWTNRSDNIKKLTTWNRLITRSRGCQLSLSKIQVHHGSCKRLLESLYRTVAETCRLVDMLQVESKESVISINFFHRESWSQRFSCCYFHNSNKPQNHSSNEVPFPRSWISCRDSLIFVVPASGPACRAAFYAGFFYGMIRDYRSQTSMVIPLDFLTLTFPFFISWQGKHS